MLKKIKLYGDLAEFIGHKEFEAVVNSTADVIKFLLCNFPKVESYMADKYYKVLVNDIPITKEQIHDPTGRAEISIVPIISGAGGEESSGIFLGLALIGGAALTGGASLAFGIGGFTNLGGAAISAAVGNVGFGLVLSGVSNLLFPQEQPKDFENDQDPRISFSFSGVQNTGRAGTSIPIVYGECITGSVVISAGTDTDQVHA